MRKSKPVCALVILALVGGCATTWQHPHRSDEQIAEDAATCEREALSLTTGYLWAAALMEEECMQDKGYTQSQ